MSLTRDQYIARWMHWMKHHGADAARALMASPQFANSPFTLQVKAWREAMYGPGPDAGSHLWDRFDWPESGPTKETP
jgi:hypothetical protein